MELLRNSKVSPVLNILKVWLLTTSQDKKARKLTKKRVRFPSHSISPFTHFSGHFTARYTAAIEAQVGGAVQHHPGEQESSALIVCGSRNINCALPRTTITLYVCNPMQKPRYVLSFPLTCEWTLNLELVLAKQGVNKIVYRTFMARQSTTSMEPSQPEYEEEEGISGAGEGDEVMEEAEQDEGYSSYILCLSGLVFLTFLQRRQHQHRP
jgi:hypothetical protein